MSRRPKWVKFIVVARIGWWAIVAQDTDDDPIEYRRWALTYRGARRKMRRMVPEDFAGATWR